MVAVRGLLIRRRETMFKDKKEQAKHWMDYAKERLVGRKIKAVRWMSEEEAVAMEWHHRPIVIHLDDGSYVFPSMDDEGSNGGALFGGTKDGDEWTFPVNGA
jgi:hypothetical protein